MDIKAVLLVFRNPLRVVELIENKFTEV